MKVLTILHKAKDRLGAFALSAYASQLTLGMVMAVFPALLVVLTIIGFWLDPQAISQELFQTLSGIVPEDVIGIFTTFLENNLPSESIGVLSFGFLILLYLVIQLLRQTMHVLNLAYDVPEERPFWKRILLLLGLFVGAILSIVIILQLLFVTTGLVAWLNYWIGFTVIPLQILTWRWPLVLFLMVALVTLSYTAIPNHRSYHLREHLAGALFFTVGWVAMTYGFNIYVSNFANYNATYGVLGTVILFIFYLQLNAYLYLLGAILNAGVIQSTQHSWWEKVRSVLLPHSS